MADNTHLALCYQVSHDSKIMQNPCTDPNCAYYHIVYKFDENELPKDDADAYMCHNFIDCTDKKCEFVHDRPVHSEDFEADYAEITELVEQAMLDDDDDDDSDELVIPVETIEDAVATVLIICPNGYACPRKYSGCQYDHVLPNPTRFQFVNPSTNQPISISPMSSTSPTPSSTASATSASSYDPRPEIICKFDGRCTKYPNCPYKHSSSTSSSSSNLCTWGLKCRNMKNGTCTRVHVANPRVDKPCQWGATCNGLRTGSCPFVHSSC